MRIVACFKNTYDEQDIQITAKRELDPSAAGWIIGPYDLNAVETAVKLSEADGAEVFALTAAGDVVDNAKQRKSILARGPATMYAVKDGRLDSADAYATSQTLAAAVRKIGDVDLVIFGEGSGDMYAQQVGVMTGAMLGWPTVNAVSKISLDGGRAMLERTTPKGTEELSVTLPAAISVTSDINFSRIPSIKDILSAGKKPFTVWTLDQVGAAADSRNTTVSILAPAEVGREKKVYEKADEESLDAIAAVIKNKV